MEDGEFIALKSHGGLKAPSQETVLHVTKCDLGFNSLHGEGAQLKDGPNIMKQTVSYILSLYPNVPSEIAELFVKVKYYARIKALNELDIRDRASELKRKAEERKVNPKKLKSVRDHVKEGVIQRFFSKEVINSLSHFFISNIYQHLLFNTFPRMHTSLSTGKKYYEGVLA